MNMLMMRQTRLPSLCDTLSSERRQPAKRYRQIESIESRQIESIESRQTESMQRRQAERL